MLILFPLLLQAASGLFLVVKEGLKYDLKRCDRGGKPRFFLQRYSGLAILAFLLIHLGGIHGWGLPFMHPRAAAFGGMPEGAAFSYTASAFQPWTSPVANFFTMILLLAGILGAAFHVANGACSGAILWKAVTTPRGKTRWSYVCAGAGVVLVAMGTAAWYAFTLSPNVHTALGFAGR
jgi:succinate dehydrogenase hydrophobic anchor subunit